MAIAGASACQAQQYHQVAQWDLHATGGFDYLAYSPTDHRLYVAQGAQVVVLDANNGNVLGNIGGLQHTHDIVLAPDGKTGYITDGGAGKVVAFDTKTLKPTGEIVTGGKNPDGAAYDPATGDLFAFNGRSNSASVIDLRSKKVIATIDLPGKPEFPVADGQGSIFDNIESANSIVHIDSRNHKVLATWKLTDCNSPSGLALDKEHHRLFSVCDGHMAVVDATNGKQVATVPIGNGPDATRFDAKRHVAFSPNGDDGTLTVVRQYSPDKYTVAQTLKTAHGGRTMALDQQSGTVFVIAPTADRHLMIDVFKP